MFLSCLNIGDFPFLLGQRWNSLMLPRMPCVCYWAPNPPSPPHCLCQPWCFCSTYVQAPSSSALCLEGAPCATPLHLCNSDLILTSHLRYYFLKKSILISYFGCTYLLHTFIEKFCFFLEHLF